MTSSAVVRTETRDGRHAGMQLAADIDAAFAGQPADAVVVFASPAYDAAELLAGLHACRPSVLVGCSSSGEFAGPHATSHSACALALRSSDVVFAASLGRGLRADLPAAARGLVSGFRPGSDPEFPFRTALILTDALAGHSEELLGELTRLTDGAYRFVGGGAGDDARFVRTVVFCGGDVLTDAAVALEMRSRRLLGIGVRHGWRPNSPPMRVTDARDRRILSINALPAVQAFEDHAARTGQSFDRADPLPFFLHNVVGIQAGGQYKLRVALSVHDDGSVSFANEVPAHALVHIMSVDTPSSVAAAGEAVRMAVEQLGGAAPEAALFFDCAATRLRMGQEFDDELREVERLLTPARFAGCNTHGQIARSDAQFNGFHNCTAVVCVFPADP